jgi:hypothetical protein
MPAKLKSQFVPARRETLQMGDTVRRVLADGSLSAPLAVGREDGKFALVTEHGLKFAYPRHGGLVRRLVKG